MPGGEGPEGRTSFFDPRGQTLVEEPQPVMRPGAWMALAGLCLLIAGQIVQWGWYEDSMGERHRLAQWTQNLDGFLATVLGAVLVAVLIYRTAAESGLRTVHYLPLALGAACLLSSVTGYRDAAVEADHYRSAGLPVEFDLGTWANLIGGMLVGVAGLLTTLAWRRNPVHGDITERGSRVEPAMDVLVGGVGAGAGLAAWVVSFGGGQVVATLWLGFMATLGGPIVALALWHRGRDFLAR